MLFDETALRAPEDILRAGVQVDCRTLARRQQDPRQIAAPTGEPLMRGGVARQLRHRLGEAVLEDDIHDLLVGRIAVFERDFLGQDVDARNRLDGDVAQLAVARNAAAVKEHQRTGAARPPRDTDVRRDRGSSLPSALRCRSESSSSSRGATASD